MNIFYLRKQDRRLIFSGGFVVIAIQMLACGSLDRGRGQVESSPLTESYKTFRGKHRQLYIQNFDNRTYSPQLTGRLKEKLLIAMTRNNSLTVTPDKEKAELILYGKILMYSEEAGVFDNASSPLTYNLTIVASTRMRVRSKNEKEANDDEQHMISYITTYNVGEPFYETRYTAEDRMLAGLADRIVSATYEPAVLKP
jgi:hypothetical protein